MAQRMMDAEVETLCGAGYGEVSDTRMNSRNGYRRREWDTRAGTMGVSTRRVERLAEQLGVTRLSKSQVSVMAPELDELVADFRNRPLDAGPYTLCGSMR